MKGILCTIILKIHDPPPPQSLSLYAAIRAVHLVGVALTHTIPPYMMVAVLLPIRRRNGSAFGRQTPCRPVAHDRP